MGRRDKPSEIGAIVAERVGPITTAPGFDATSRDHLLGLVSLANRLAEVTDLEAVLDAVIDAAMTMLRPAACAIDLLGSSGGGPVLSLARGLDEPCANWWRIALPLLPAHPDPEARAVAWPGDLCPRAPAFALRLALALPDQPGLGALTLFVDDPAHTAAWPAAVLHSLVRQASAAVTGSRVRLRDLLAVYSVAQTITGRIEIAQLAEALLQGVVSLFTADSGALILADSGASASGTLLTTRHGDGVVADSQTLLDCGAQGPAPAVLTALDPPVRALAGRRGRGLITPLLLERKVFGVLVLAYEREETFRQSDLWTLSAIASHVTMALRNAQLYLWSEELAIADERSRIAREIHDGLAQSLAHKIMRLDLCLKLINRDHVRLAAELETLKESVRADIQDVRHSILALRPLDLEQRGLSEAVQAYINQFSHDTGIRIDTTIVPLEAIAPKVQTALFRLVQEALNNIRKHAQATTASVSIALDGGWIVMRVSDTGRGFDVAEALRRVPGQTGIGLKGMLERTTAAGGTLTIASSAGQGASVEVRLPVRS